MATFNLIDEGWIPCRERDGKIAHLGLRDTLARAHELDEVFDPSPVITVGLHRLLLAVLHRVFGPANPSSWTTLWQRRAWDAVALDSYFDQQRPNLDLFGAERPFYQARGPLDAKWHPIARLTFERAAGNNATLFDHSTRANAAPVSPAEAARLLVGLQPFAVAGGVSQPFNLTDGPLARGYTLLALGDNLFETLALNLVRYDASTPVVGTGDDRPAWEQDDPATPDRNGTQPRGYLDYLTWQSRRVRLATNEDGQVTECQLLQNLSLPRAAIVLDPFKSYTIDSERGRLPRRFDEGRAVWRDSAALFAASDGRRDRTGVLEWLGSVETQRRERKIEARRAYRIAVAGIATHPMRAASVTFWRHERLPLPLAYLDQPSLTHSLHRALVTAEAVGALFSAGFLDGDLGNDGKPRRLPRPFQVVASTLASTHERQAAQSAVDALATRLRGRHAFWSRLEVPFRQFLVDLAEDRKDVPNDEPLFGTRKVPIWLKEVRRAAYAAYDEVTACLDRSGRGLEATTLGRRSLGRWLHRILADQIESFERESA